MEPKSTDVVDTNLSNPVVFENLSGEPSGCTFKILNIFAKSSEEDSLTRNEAVSGNSEIPSTSKGLTSHLEPEPKTTKKRKSDVWRSETAAENDSRVTPGPGDRLCKDELTPIFSNTWLSAQDLLNFRLVSKRWRDAATTTLRRRDACVVELWAEPDLDLPCVYKNNAKYTDEYALSQLTELISISPMFPATDFRIHIPLFNLTPYNRLPDLLNFFKLHGDKIKTLRQHGSMTRKLLLDILQIYAPALESLDLSDADVLESDEEDDGEGNALKWTSKAVLLKSITLGSLGLYSQQYKHEFFRLLLSSPSKLSCIENVTLATLQMVLTEGKFGVSNTILGMHFGFSLYNSRNWFRLIRNHTCQKLLWT